MAKVTLGSVKIDTGNRASTKVKIKVKVKQKGNYDTATVRRAQKQIENVPSEGR